MPPMVLATRRASPSTGTNSDTPMSGGRQFVYGVFVFVGVGATADGVTSGP